MRNIGISNMAGQIVDLSAAILNFGALVQVSVSGMLIFQFF